MTIPDLFLNHANRLRSGWRFAAFVVAYLLVFLSIQGALGFVVALALPDGSYQRLVESDWGYVLQGVVLFIPAALVGWGCNFVLEDLPWRALGWTLHRGWLGDLSKGLLLGALSIALATLVGIGFGGLRLSMSASALWSSVLWTFTSSAFIFLLGAAAEETMFRAYPLQTLMRSWPVWLALIPSSLIFAAGHLGNPNVVPGVTYVNTFLAGAWLAVAYARTRSLWFPFGLHWSWNWTMGALLGIPVSGITKLTPEPLLRPESFGDAWLTGGTYGLEGGAACTIALLLTTLFIWRTRMLSAVPDLKRLSDEENPNPSTASIQLR
jgi:hypothetical protein